MLFRSVEINANNIYNPNFYLLLIHKRINLPCSIYWVSIRRDGVLRDLRCKLRSRLSVSLGWLVVFDCLIVGFSVVMLDYNKEVIVV